MGKKDKQDDALQVKTVTKKRGGCGTFFMGFLFCFVFLFVCIGGAGLYCYYNLNVNSIERMLGIEIPLEGDYKTMALKDLIAVALQKKDSITEATLESIQTDFSVNLPATIPGTEISLTEIYDSEIDFLNQRKKVKQFRIQDIVNNLNAFVDAVLPVLYDNTTVDEVLNSFNVTMLEDLGYPALVDKFYNTGTSAAPVMKSLRELTISQAFDKLPEYFGEETLTVQNAIDALGLEILPYPAEGQNDVYAPVRSLVIAEVTNDDIMGAVDGAMLIDLIDLSGFKFTQTAEFKATKLNAMSAYFDTVSLEQFVEIPENVDETSTATDLILNALKGLTYGDLKKSDIAAELIAQIDENSPNLSLADLLKIDDTTGVMGIIGQVKFKDILGTNGEDAILNALKGSIENPVTLGKLLKINETSGIMSLIQGVKMGDLIGDGANAAEAIMNALKSDGNTLGTLLEITDTTGFAGKIANISLADLLNGGTGATDAIKNTVNSMSLGDVFGDDIFDSASANYNKMFAALGKDTTINSVPDKFETLALGDIFDDGVFTAGDAKYNKVLAAIGKTTKLNEIPAAIDGVSLSDVVGAQTGIFKLIANYNTSVTTSDSVVHPAVTLGNLDDIVIVENLTLNILVEAGILTSAQIEGLDGTKTIDEIIAEYKALKAAAGM